MTNFRTGERVWITCEDRRVEGTIVLASDNGRSLALGFEAILAGHVGMMPVLRDEDGTYRTLIGATEVGIERVE